MINIIQEKIQKILTESQDKLTYTDKQELDACRYILKYIEANVKLEIADEVLRNNETIITEYDSYLNEEIQRKAKELARLSEKDTIGRSKRKLAKFVRDAETKLEIRQAEKKSLKKGLKNFVENVYNIDEKNAQELSRKAMQSLFSYDLLSTTSFYTNENKFFENNELNISNVNLVLDVFLNRNLMNLKLLTEIKELESKNNFLQFSIKKGIDNSLLLMEGYTKEAANTTNKLSLNNLKESFLSEFDAIFKLLKKCNRVLGIPLSTELDELLKMKKNLEPFELSDSKIQLFLSEFESRIDHLMKNIEQYRIPQIESNQNKIEENRKLVPDEMKNADIRCLNRINYYCNLAFTKSSDINPNENFSFNDERIKVIVSHLELAKNIYAITTLDRKDLLATVANENDLTDLYQMGEHAFDQLISFDGPKR